ncbi:unnamed protein product [Dibothriocephalus latus]|uniref:Uncharacterized protein n=1 Tax=Dibothriocephalus latus TaxID=60516 RepID=A0A3P7LK77_DIBLA|nr:unnamed protein product [Dibothriocephalus latus]
MQEVFTRLRVSPAEYKAAFVDNELMPCEDIDINMSEFGGEPNKTFHISAELRKSSTEGMFRPCMTKNFEPNAPSLPRLLRQCLQACSIESRQALCANVLLVGEYAGIEGHWSELLCSSYFLLWFTGLQQRLQSEIQQFLPKNTILSVKTVPNSAEAAYSGACLTSALLQGPRAPQCQWFKFMEPAMWDSIKASAPGGQRLVDRLNAQMCWP